MSSFPAADSAGVSGFAGVVSENSAVPSVSCYVLGLANATSVVNVTVTWSGYEEIYLDEQTDGAWSLPIREAIDNGYYFRFASSGPDMFRRLEGSLRQSDNGMETFINMPRIIASDVPVKPDQVSLAYLYFSGNTYTGYPVRGLQDWFRSNATISARYNLTELMS